MRENTTRRRLLEIVSGGGAIALAGCTGNSEDGSSGENSAANSDEDTDQTTITLGTSSDGSSSWTIGQAVQAEVQRNTDIRLAAERTDGYASNIGLAADDGVDAIMVFNNMYRDAIESQFNYEGEDYSVEDLGWQGMSTLSGEYLLVTTQDSDIEYYRDLEGRDVATFPTGTGIKPQFDSFMNRALDMDPEEDFNRLDLSFTDHSSALRQGRVDACGFFTHNNGEIWSGTWQELSAQNDIRPLQIHPDSLEEAKQTMGNQLREQEYPVVDQEGFNNVEAPCVFLVGFTVIDQDVSAEDWYEITEATVENIESIREAADLLWDVSVEENFTAGIYEDYPVHPGVANFLKDKGWWNNDWTVGGE